MKIILGAVSLVLAFALCQPAVAGDYPSRPIRLLCPFGAGQAADVGARIISQKLSEMLKTPIVVENRPGAGGNIAASVLLTAKPDGYTLFVGSTATQIITPELYPALDAKPGSFIPIAYTGWTPFVLSIGPMVSASSLKQFFDSAPKGGYQVAVSSPGAQLATLLLSRESGVKLTPIRYNSSGIGASDVMGGRVPLMIDSLPSQLALIRSGRMKALAMSAPTRSTSAPDIPTMAEAGLKDFALTTWNVVYAPPGTPQQIVQQLNAAFAQVLSQPDTREALARAGYAPAPVMDLPQVESFVKAETTKWTDLVRSSGMVNN